jgi:hypothetical protein
MKGHTRRAALSSGGLGMVGVLAAPSLKGQ